MKRIAIALVLAVFTGCAAARLPKGPDVYSLPEYPSAPKVGVAKVADARESTKAGHIGATSVRVDKDVADLTTNYLLDALNRDMKLNVAHAEATGPAGIASMASQQGMDAVLVSAIKRVEMSSADAVMQPVHTVVDMECVVYGRDGSERYRRLFSGSYDKRIGITIVDKATGELVENAVKETVTSLAKDPGLNENWEATIAANSRHGLFIICPPRLE
jgi:hypothetical protein